MLKLTRISGISIMPHKDAVYQNTPQNHYEMSVINCGIMSFWYLLNTPERIEKQFSLAEFAEMIEKHANTQDLKAQEAIRLLKKHSEYWQTGIENI